MPNYIVDGRDTNTANTSILGVTRGSGRLLIYEVMVGPTGAAGGADNLAEYHFQRTTAAGTATAVTPKPTNPADKAASATAGEKHTVEPTFTADEIMLIVPKHLRACIIWTPRESGDEIVVPDSANAGLAARSVSVNTVWEEAVSMRFRE